MIDFVIFSLIYGPVAVTLACWLFFTIEAGRAKRRGCLQSEPKPSPPLSEAPRLLMLSLWNAAANCHEKSPP